MPFFQRPPVIMKKKEPVTLQVRIPQIRCGHCKKRVFSSAPLWRPMQMRRLPAGLTVEAALALSLFLFAMVILMAPMKMMNDARRIQTALDSACEKASQLAVLMPEEGEVPEGSRDSSMIERTNGLGRGFTKAGVLLFAGEEVRRRVRPEKAGQFSFIDSSILEDGETIDLILHYRLFLPFPVFRMESVPMTARSCRRAWIGKKGGTGSGEEEDEVVYIGKNSTRYHRNRNCHYLNNDVDSVAYDTIDSLRNAEGKRYRACARCGAGVQPKSTVYIMPSGESYHSDRNCSSIIAYVRAVPLSEVAYLGACSYCSN